MKLTNNPPEFTRQVELMFEKKRLSEPVDDPGSWYRMLGEVSFEIKPNENLNPYDISYNDYKKLNYEALETIFGKGKNLDDAVGLLVTTDITDDDVLNKIFFDKELKTKGEGEESRMYDYSIMMVATMHFGDHLNALEKGYFYDTGRTTSTKDKLFDDFDKFKEYFHSNLDGWTGTIDIEGVFNTMDEIKTEYEKRAAENEALLKELTKNNKPNPLETIESSDG